MTTQPSGKEQMATNEANVLLPCPFCGGAAAFGHVEEEDGHPDAGAHYAVCMKCGASSILRFACGDDPLPLLAEAWNKRATQPPPTAAKGGDAWNADHVNTREYLTRLADCFRRASDLWEGPDGCATPGTQACERVEREIRNLATIENENGFTTMRPFALSATQPNPEGFSVSAADVAQAGWLLSSGAPNVHPDSMSHDEAGSLWVWAQDAVALLRKLSALTPDLSTPTSARGVPVSVVDRAWAAFKAEHATYAKPLSDDALKGALGFALCAATPVVAHGEAALPDYARESLDALESWTRGYVMAEGFDPKVEARALIQYHRERQLAALASQPAEGQKVTADDAMVRRAVHAYDEWMAQHQPSQDDAWHDGMRAALTAAIAPDTGEGKN